MSVLPLCLHCVPQRHQLVPLRCRQALLWRSGAHPISAAMALYSVILPTFNERDNLPLILTLIADTFAKL